MNPSLELCTETRYPEQRPGGDPGLAWPGPSLAVVTTWRAFSQLMVAVVVGLHYHRADRLQTRVLPSQDCHASSPPARMARAADQVGIVQQISLSPTKHHTWEAFIFQNEIERSLPLKPFIE